MTKADVSVVIPCYHCASTIERCVQSVMNQTLLPKEIILVNDASDDQLENILIKLQSSCNSDLSKLSNLTQTKGLQAQEMLGGACLRVDL